MWDSHFIGTVCFLGGWETGVYRLNSGFGIKNLQRGLFGVAATPVGDRFLLDFDRLLSWLSSLLGRPISELQQ